MTVRKKSGRRVSRVLSLKLGVNQIPAGNHSSRIAIARDLKRSTRMLTSQASTRSLARTHSVGSCSRWGLPSDGSHPPPWWALTPPFHPYRTICIARRSAFCCTFPSLAAGRRYRPSRSAEPGLSSKKPRIAASFSAIAQPPGERIIPLPTFPSSPNSDNRTPLEPPRSSDRQNRDTIHPHFGLLSRRCFQSQPDSRSQPVASNPLLAADHVASVRMWESKPDPHVALIA